jgi:hypothetical protein
MWQLKVTLETDEEGAQQVLDEGWEPFAVDSGIVIAGGAPTHLGRIWFRREVDLTAAMGFQMTKTAAEPATDTQLPLPGMML